MRQNNFLTVKKTVTAFMISLSSLALHAQSIAWEKNLGGSLADNGLDVKKTTDGGYIVAGNTKSSANGNVTGSGKGLMDAWVVKLDAAGAIEWQKNYGGAGNDNASLIMQTSDGGYFFAGYTESSPSGDVTGTILGFSDLWAVKLDASGNISWEKNFGGSGIEIAYGILQTSDGGYFIAASTTTATPSGTFSGTSKGAGDVWAVKLSSTGTLAWEKNYGGNSNDTMRSIKETSDGYIMAGNTQSTASGDLSGTNRGSGDAWIIKLDTAGAIAWEKNYGGSGNDIAYSIHQTTDGGYIVSGTTSSSASGEVVGTNKGLNDVWIIKLTSTGAITWEKNLGGSGSEVAYDVHATSDGGYVLAGYTTSSATGDLSGTTKGGTDIWLFKINATGTLLWEKNYGGAGSDILYSFQPTAEGGFILVGSTNSSASGDVTGTGKGDYDFWIVKLGAASTLSNTQAVKSSLSVFPNPASSYFSVNGLRQKSTVEVVDMTGKTVLSENINNGEQISTAALQSGLYLVKVGEQTSKLIIKK